MPHRPRRPCAGMREYAGMDDFEAVTYLVVLPQAELDLFWQARGQNWGAEFKYEDAPRLTRSMKTAVEDLELERLWVVYLGKATYPLAEKIGVLPLADVRGTWNYG
jgi:predicted AAA+ superfamily ATPase